jgi:hypothetical protein
MTIQHYYDTPTMYHYDTLSITYDTPTIAYDTPTIAYDTPGDNQLGHLIVCDDDWFLKPGEKVSCFPAQIFESCGRSC